MPNLISPNELKNRLPLQNQRHIEDSRTTIGKIINGQDSRLLLIVGPCSIHSIEAAKEYARRLKRLSTDLQDVFFICMRAYFEKPRTALGWKGFLYDPFLDGSYSLHEGIKLSRELLLYLSELELPAATEFLEPLYSSYISDVISWGSIGARTSQSPIHRQLASNLPMPIGFKNRCDGNIDIAIQASLTARQSHHFIGIDQDAKACQINSPGNEHTHLVLRGSTAKPNFDVASIEKASRLLKQTNLPQGIVVDCSHDNSRKNHLNQKFIFNSLVNQIATSTSAIRGIMVESFIEAGQQTGSLSSALGQSITDPCLDWETTEHIIRQGADILRQKVLSCV